jgi:hypothetical protein
VVPNHLAFAAAAAIRYDPGSDSTQSLAGEIGIDAVLTSICGISVDDPLAGLIKAADAEIASGLQPDT